MLMPLEKPHRDAWIPPAPDADDERVRREALAELSELIAELERWRRRQAMRKPSPGTGWVFVRSRDGVDVRIRFERGLPTQLRATGPDRAYALEVVGEVLDLALVADGVWERDARALDWHLPVAIQEEE